MRIALWILLLSALPAPAADFTGLNCGEDSTGAPVAELQRMGKELVKAVSKGVDQTSCDEILWSLADRNRQLKIISEKGYPVNQEKEDSWMTRVEEAAQVISSKKSQSMPDLARDPACLLYRDLSLAIGINSDKSHNENSISAGLEELKSELGLIEDELRLLGLASSAEPYLECISGREISLPSAEAMKVCATELRFADGKLVAGLLEKEYRHPHRLACLVSARFRARAEAMITEASGFKPKIDRILASSRSTAKEREKRRFEFYQRLYPKFSRLKTYSQERGFACEEQFRAEKERFKQRLRLLKYTDSKGEGTGTGFFVRTSPAGSVFVTAEHVAFSGEKSRAPRTLKVTDHEQKATEYEALRFEQKPGLYDFAHDAVQMTAPAAADAFLPAAEGELPKLGQEFELLGLASRPAVLGGWEPAYVRYRCYFAGIDRGLRNEASYAFHCPTRNAPGGGSSGGAMVDDQGKVWGIISGGISAEKVVAATPVSLGKGGVLNFGFNHSFHFSHCLNIAKLSDARPCQVIPGLTFEKSVP